MIIILTAYDIHFFLAFYFSLLQSGDLFTLLDEVYGSDTGASLENCTTPSTTTESSEREEKDAACPAQSPHPVVGASPTQLDSLNELIKSEHFYVKYAPSSAEDSSSSSGCSSDEDEVSPNEEVQESSPSAMPVKEEFLSLTDDCFSFAENMMLFESLMKECLSNDEGTTTSEELPDSVIMKNDESCDMPAQESKTTSLIPTNRKRTSEDENVEIVNKLPKTGSITDSGSDSGIHSDYSNPSSPYQEQSLLQFNDMNPVDDILFPELFPCLI